MLTKFTNFHNKLVKLVPFKANKYDQSPVSVIILKCGGSQATNYKWTMLHLNEVGWLSDGCQKQW